jgi:hypothetical protein
MPASFLRQIHEELAGMAPLLHKQLQRSHSLAASAMARREKTRSQKLPPS